MSANSLLGYGFSQAERFDLHRESLWEYECFPQIKHRQKGPVLPLKRDCLRAEDD